MPNVVDHDPGQPVRGVKGDRSSRADGGDVRPVAPGKRINLPVGADHRIRRPVQGIPSEYLAGHPHQVLRPVVEPLPAARLFR